MPAPDLGLQATMSWSRKFMTRLVRVKLQVQRLNSKLSPLQRGMEALIAIVTSLETKRWHVLHLGRRGPWNSVRR